MTTFKDMIAERTLLGDGAMGTMLQESGLTPGACPEILNLEDPGTVSTVHRKYIDAGADLVETNTFGGNRIKLSSFGLEKRTEEINDAAVRIARKAAGGGILVAGSVGPTGRVTWILTKPWISSPSRFRRWPEPGWTCSSSRPFRTSRKSGPPSLR